MTEIIYVCDSWWPTRSPIGIHILNPTTEQLAKVKALCESRNVPTLYVYKCIKVGK